ncbi:hypothetical protein FZI85_29170 [Mycobacterium sp. CBMA293]|uniref:hypothetical protein n=1 Tax=unclassified Mycolicibacterium TaxID=2636767 RepID=UPI0012DD872F|nr:MULTISPECIES: hypothetical protein [unclassified Mycolicibacterium]MUL49920.1 hypothetical protein [Mycolicibacterium sp. CBMA 360]MUL61630.1 hypothetical protein [Mycolicibacterium sp. CBMA 335]MUL74366.1 hypothetical protein [Mycolicibacterium sp. CBMA 311]MUL96643.1 hypothetical protein [Mycolicibacterium sp. CBMA 230]MUM04196.1 hypothetical protein [Mycolicibacterium sp. CBMA 213]
MLKYLFDVRVIVGALLGIYGLLLTVAGFFPSILGEHAHSTNTDTVHLYAGTDANWWVGLVLLVVAAAFIGWAVARPPEVTEAAEVNDTEV